MVLKFIRKLLYLTTGTFLRGVVHIGDSSYSGGRMGDKAAFLLAERIDSFCLPLGRLKTGTPPRLDSQTIAWEQLEFQAADKRPYFIFFYVEQTSASPSKLWNYSYKPPNP